MTEQDRQLIKDKLHHNVVVTQQDIYGLLIALDERDREVERLQEERENVANYRNECRRSGEENQHLRNALEEIINTYLCECGDLYRDCICGFRKIRHIARQALAGEEKG